MLAQLVKLNGAARLVVAAPFERIPPGGSPCARLSSDLGQPSKGHRAKTSEKSSRWTGLRSSSAILPRQRVPLSQVYLIKPVNPHRLADALQRIIHAPPQAQTKPFLPSDRILLRTGKTARVVYVSHISGIKAEENYTDVLVADGSTVFMRRTISEWEELLPKPPFFTPHRSLIVNLQAVGDLVLQSRAEVSL